MVVADEFFCDDALYSKLKNKTTDLTTEETTFIQEYTNRCLAYAPKEKPEDAKVAPVQQSCYPPCRVGFICYNGQCVSECNPPCPAGTICKENNCVKVADQAKTNDSLKNPYKRKGGKVGVWTGFHVLGLATALSGSGSEAQNSGLLLTALAIPFIISGIVETVRCLKWEQEHKGTSN